MDMSQFASVVSTCLSIVISWRNILDAAWNLLSTSITSTATSPTIDLKTLRSCALALTPHDIIQAEIKAPGSKLNALLAARYLNAASARLNATLELSVLGNAIEMGHTSRLDGLGLEPNYRPIILAMKPLDGTFAHNAIEHGVAGLWIDGGRIETSDDLNGGTYTGTSRQQGSDSSWQNDDRSNGKGSGFKRGVGEFTQPKGRFPANLILSHHPDCVEFECVEDCPVRMLDAQSGIQTDRPAKKALSGEGSGSGLKSPGTVAMGAGILSLATVGYQTTGGASRFFYCAKASRSERTCNGTIENKHPTVKPLALMRYLVKITRTPAGGVVLDPFSGSGSTACACIEEYRDCIAIEKDLASFETMQARVETAQTELAQLNFAIEVMA
jgi:site-specific DNA-methyltransferase (adenine-specific)